MIDFIICLKPKVLENSRYIYIYIHSFFQMIFYLRLLLSLYFFLLKLNPVCNFQSVKSPVELESLFLEFFCYITWFD